ncbi:MAG TPA: protein phosphatase 2C domain-containing protein [Candidatus Ozemobacteraceae bacterium]|nr:protein phosphatase 2C domain-containing protein [Candidatus Ozemobacteraceae bacterium]HQG30120.1 protein phosphatase 2C domain-containing protein [Candidatus Ozemobacteraceae bacterium]
MQISFHTDRGLVRKNNEDSSLAIPPWQEPAISAGACMFGVADGMGGHAAGEVASGLATATLKTWLSSQRPDRVAGPAEVESAFLEANFAIWEYVKKHADCQGMGTTLTAGFISDNRMILCHVGDSRVYLLRSGQLKQLTSDHTLVAEQVRAGKLDEAAARCHPARHILSRALGVREFITVDTTVLELAVGDTLLFCSDGIYGPVSDDIIREELARRPFNGAAKRLVELACKGGGPDNATAVAVLIDELPVSYPGRYSWQRFRSILGEWGILG